MASVSGLPPLPPGAVLDEDEEDLPILPPDVTLDPPKRAISQQDQFSFLLGQNPGLGQAAKFIYDNLIPTVHESAPVTLSDRAKVNFSTTNPLERAKAFKGLGYPNVTVAENQVLVDNKPVDKPPLSLPSISEYASEVIENVDLAPGALIFTNPFSAIIGTAATAIGREQLRQKVVPNAKPDYLTGTIETGLAAVPLIAKLGSPLLKKVVKDYAIKPGRNAVNKGVTSGKGLIGKTVETAQEGFSKYADNLSDIQKHVVEIFQDTFGENATLKQLGISDQKLNLFNLETANDHLAALAKDSPEFIKISKLTGSGVRARRAAALHTQVGEAIGEYFTKSTDTIPLKDIFSSDSYTDMINAMNNLQYGDDVVKGLYQQHDAMIENLWRSVQANKILARPGIEQAIESSGKPTNQFLREIINTESARFGPERKLQELAQETISLKDAWGLRRFYDDWSAYTATQLVGETPPEKVLMYRKLANTFREVINSKLPEGSQIAKDMRVYHHLTPLVEDMVADFARKSGKVIRPNDIYVSALGGPVYRGIGYAGKISKNPTLRGSAESGFNYIKELVKDFTSQTGKTISESVNPNVSDGLSPYLAGFGSTAYSRKFASNLLNQPQPLQGPIPETMTYEDLQGSLPQVQPKPLSRDPNLIGKDPQDIGLIEQATHPDTALLFKDAINSDDPLKKRLAMVRVMQEAPELFEPAMYGLRSIIAEDDRFVLGDVSEAKLYRQTIKHLKGLGKVSEGWYTKQLSALNDLSDMTIYPRPDILDKPPTIPQQPNPSKLDRIKTIAGERRTYDY